MSFKKKFSSRERGQVNSPFELLVAMIIMSFVVIIGAQMIAATNRQVCSANVDRAMTDFKLRLEETISDRTSNRFTFNPVTNNCYNESSSSMRIENIRDSRACSNVCGRAVNSCFVMIFGSDDIGVSKSKCLNIPVYTSFVSGDSSCPRSGDLAEYFSIDVMSSGVNLRSGNYVLRVVSPVGATHPQVCIYYRR